MFHPPACIYFYNEGVPQVLDLEALTGYIEKKTGLKPNLRKSLIPKDRESIDLLAKERAKAKVINLKNQEILEPLPAEIEYEKRRLSGTLGSKSASLLYDGYRLLESYSKLIPKNEFNLRNLHIIFTNELFGTWDESGGHYHARVAVFSFPTLISTTGIVEAPAKPREFYLKKQFGIDPFVLKEEFRGRFIDYEDTRLAEVIKGYVMQTFFFHLTGDPFCEDPDCRLYNAHWQEEVIRSQIESKYEFCEGHNRILKTLVA